MKNLVYLYVFNDGYYHKVTSKDTLWTISQRYDVDLKELMEINNLNNVSVHTRDFIMVRRK